MVLLGKIMILQGVGHPISCHGVCYADDPKKGGYTPPAPALDLTTSLRGDFSSENSRVPCATLVQCKDAVVPVLTHPGNGNSALSKAKVRHRHRTAPALQDRAVVARQRGLHSATRLLQGGQRSLSCAGPLVHGQAPTVPKENSSRCSTPQHASTRWWGVRSFPERAQETKSRPKHSEK